MGGSAERFESLPNKEEPFPNLSLASFNLADVKATAPAQNRIYGPQAGEQLQGSVDLQKLKDKNLPVYDFGKDPAMSEFQNKKAEPKIPLGNDMNIKIGGLLNFSIGKSWKF
ncbi:MAG: hypothetical protein K2X77_14655 [Candidatus Obscuribacterales bacterium]|jgi:hypothetical protein|nr:hypothetical protein [Candidatus Obscuribacterales bacterium]